MPLNDRHHRRSKFLGEREELGKDMLSGNVGGTLLQESGVQNNLG